MALDIKAFQTAVYAHSENGVLRLSKDGQSLENIGTGTLGSLRVKFVRDGEQNRQVREHLFTAIRSSLIEGTSSPNFTAFMKSIAGQLGLSTNDKGELLTGQGNPAVQDKPLMRREVANLLRQTSAARDSGAFDPAWMQVIRRNVGGFTWHHENMKDKLRTAGWSSSDKVREAVVAALLKNSEEALALAKAGKTSESQGGKPVDQSKTEPPKAEPPKVLSREEIRVELDKCKGSLATLQQGTEGYSKELEKLFAAPLRKALGPYFKAQLSNPQVKTRDGSLRLSEQELSQARREAFANMLAARKEPHTESDTAELMRVLDWMPEEVLAMLDPGAESEDAQRVQARHEAVYSIVANVAANCGLLQGQEALPEGTSAGQAKVPVFTDGAVKERATNERIDPALSHLVKSVQDNPSDGHCFFYSALDQMSECKEKTSCDNAVALRKALVDHARELKAQARDGKLDEHGLKVANGVWSVPSSGGRRVIDEAIRQLDSTDFRDAAEWADYSQAAFLADLVKRPVRIVSTSLQPGNLATFDRDLTTGEKLPGKPIDIYYTPGHFRSCKLKNEM